MTMPNLLKHLKKAEEPFFNYAVTRRAMIFSFVEIGFSAINFFYTH